MFVPLGVGDTGETRMFVVVADDKPQTLSLVERWFDRAFSKDSEMKLATHSDLESLEEFIQTTVKDQDHLLLLLDLNWNDDKQQALRWMRRVKHSLPTRHWPILIYSESTDEVDVRDAHDHFANGYVHKGEDRQEDHFVKVLN